MSLPVRKFRELVFQGLYAYSGRESDREELMALLMREGAVTKKTIHAVLERIEEIFPLLPTIDQQLDSVSQEYSLERIQSVEKAILRLAVYEMLYDEAIPRSVAISEAIRLTKKFSTPEASSLVNALLDALPEKS